MSLTRSLSCAILFHSLFECRNRIKFSKLVCIPDPPALHALRLVLISQGFLYWEERQRVIDLPFYLLLQPQHGSFNEVVSFGIFPPYAFINCYFLILLFLEVSENFQVVEFQGKKCSLTIDSSFCSWSFCEFYGGEVPRNFFLNSWF